MLLRAFKTAQRIRALLSAWGSRGLIAHGSLTTPELACQLCLVILSCRSLWWEGPTQLHCSQPCKYRENNGGNIEETATQELRKDSLKDSQKTLQATVKMTWGHRLMD